VQEYKDKQWGHVCIRMCALSSILSRKAIVLHHDNNGERLSQIAETLKHQGATGEGLPTVDQQLVCGGL